MEEVSSWEPRNLVERRISKLPCVRQARYRVDRGWVVLGNHSSYRQAIMAFIRGYIPNRPYGHCRDGHGPMTECVRLEADAEHFFSGARSNCHWGGPNLSLFLLPAFYPRRKPCAVRWPFLDPFWRSMTSYTSARYGLIFEESRAKSRKRIE
jgi:hypothetical protein